MGSQEVTLSWEGHYKTMISVFEKLLESSSLVDCTIVAEGRQRKAHKEVLLAFSPYFQVLMEEENEKNPTIILSGFTFQELSALIDYMYYGKVVVTEDKVENLIDAAQSLQIRGLGGDQDVSSESKTGCSNVCPRPAEPSRTAHKRRRTNDIEELSMETGAGIKSHSVIVPQTLPLIKSSSHRLKENESGIRSTVSLQSNVNSGPTSSDFSMTENEFNVLPKSEDVDTYANNTVNLESIEDNVAILGLAADISVDNGQDLYESVPWKQDSSQMSNLPPAVPPSSIVTPLDTGNILASPSNEQGQNMILSSSEGVFEPSAATGYELSAELKVKAEPVDEYLNEETMEEAIETEAFGSEMVPDEQELYHGAEFADTEKCGKQYHQLASGSQKCSDIRDAVTGTMPTEVAVGKKAHILPYLVRSQEKLYVCTVCKSGFRNASTLRRHTRTHTGERPYKCPECDFASVKSDNLTVHRRTHTGEKPYKCSECEYASAQSGALAKHRRIHTGVKPFKCAECDYASTDSSSLARHRRRRH